MTTDLKLAPIPCATCNGEKKLLVELPPRRVYQLVLDHAERSCKACDGTGVEACVSCGDRPATVRGEDGRCYCGTSCGFEDGNWPGCRACEKAPQSPKFAPFCGAACQAQFLGGFEQRARLA